MSKKDQEGTSFWNSFEGTLGKSPSALKCLGIDLSKIMPNVKQRKKKIVPKEKGENL